MGVNLFPGQFHGGTLLADVETALLLSGLPAEDLEIEITENIALAHDDATLAPLRTLRSKGVKLAFDDFGTGYASLSYLARYPLSRIKIDQSFVRKISDSPSREDTAIVRSIIVMAHNLGLEVIAEGVETAAQAAFLRAEKCEEVQGFLYSRPLPRSEFQEFVRSNRATDTAEQPAIERFRLSASGFRRNEQMRHVCLGSKAERLGLSTTLPLHAQERTLGSAIAHDREPKLCTSRNELDALRRPSADRLGTRHQPSGGRAICLAYPRVFDLSAIGQF